MLIVPLRSATKLSSRKLRSEPIVFVAVEAICFSRQWEAKFAWFVPSLSRDENFADP